ncbi:MAG: rhodanese-like domain-containing protein [Bacilli bacterium]|nr:rhodanese-like domain-containing protein [Bacillota bacterium]MBR6820837.1 rhodanese-like domain-containing protein [Bacilli bacterium]
MKKIKLSEYKESMGVFIEINNNYNHIVKTSIHIPYDNLLTNYKELLDKSKKYFIYCTGGIKSKKAVNILDYYGYDVTLVNK